MENFFYEDRFCSNVEDFISSVYEEDEEVVRALPDDWKEKIFPCQQQPVVAFDAELLMECVQEDRYSGDGDEYEQILAVLKKYKVELEAVLNKINAEVPKLYYPNGKAEYLTKEDLLQAL